MTSLLALLSSSIGLNYRWGFGLRCRWWCWVCVAPGGIARGSATAARSGKQGVPTIPRVFDHRANVCARFAVGNHPTPEG